MVEACLRTVIGPAGVFGAASLPTLGDSGFLFDSFRGLMLFLDEKVALLLSQAAELSLSDRL